jgi:hypothetical protein
MFITDLKVGMKMIFSQVVGTQSEKCQKKFCFVAFGVLIRKFTGNFL